MILAVERIAILLGDFPIEMVMAVGGVGAVVVESRLMRIECRLPIEFGTRDCEERSLSVGQTFERLVLVDPQPLSDILIEMIQQGLPRDGHPRLDLLIEFGLKLIEGTLDLILIAAGLVDLGDTPLDVHA